jgi:hypothetical protein
MNTKRKLIALLAIATLISIVNASVFVYYPINLTISPQNPPVVFSTGSNSNERDLWDKTITVDITDGVADNEGTRLTIEVHPTLQKNYYYDIAKIKNNDDKHTYYIKFRVTSCINDDRVYEAYLIINGDYDNKIDLKSGGVQPDNWIELSSSSAFRVDLYIVLDSVGSSDITVGVDLIISTTSISTTSTESPPTTLPGE